jgi:acetate kinase
MKKDILVINCGSSSIKFALIDPESRATSLSGLAEKLNQADAYITFKYDGQKSVQQLPDGGHAEAMKSILKQLADLGLIASIAAVGHRVVHGGEHFKASTLIDDHVIAAIADCCKLAPLHNPGHLQGIHGAMTSFPDLPQAVVFDTAFHQTMPEHAYLYAIPMSLYRDQRIRRYGFHGTSHHYVSQESARQLGIALESSCFISAHLGNGASACAIKNGKSVDTTMGLTPLDGLVMGTRCGDIDPSIFGFLASTLYMDIQAITDMLNKQSGLLGLSELSNDCRELLEAAKEGHLGAKMALEIFCYRLAKHIAALVVPLGRVDALLFTGGIGENSAWVRKRVMEQLGFLGFKLDSVANDAAVCGKGGLISQPGSTMALVVNTNEELMIAQDTAKLVGLNY